MFQKYLPMCTAYQMARQKTRNICCSTCSNLAVLFCCWEPEYGKLSHRVIVKNSGSPAQSKSGLSFQRYPRIKQDYIFKIDIGTISSCWTSFKQKNQSLRVSSPPLAVLQTQDWERKVGRAVVWWPGGGQCRRLRQTRPPDPLTLESWYRRRASF